MTITPKDLSDYFQTLGRKGGQTTSAIHGREYFSKIGKLGMQKRWAKAKNKKVI